MPDDSLASITSTLEIESLENENLNTNELTPQIDDSSVSHEQSKEVKSITDKNPDTNEVIAEIKDKSVSHKSSEEIEHPEDRDLETISTIHEVKESDNLPITEEVESHENKDVDSESLTSQVIELFNSPVFSFSSLEIKSRDNDKKSLDKFSSEDRDSVISIEDEESKLEVLNDDSISKETHYSEISTKENGILSDDSFDISKSLAIDDSDEDVCKDKVGVDLQKENIVPNSNETEKVCDNKDEEPKLNDDEISSHESIIDTPTSKRLVAEPKIIQPSTPKHGEKKELVSDRSVIVPLTTKKIVIDLLEAMEIVAPDLEKKTVFTKKLKELTLSGIENLEKNTRLMEKLEKLKLKILKFKEEANKKKKDVIEEISEKRSRRTHYDHSLHDDAALILIQNLFEAMSEILEEDKNIRTGKGYTIRDKSRENSIHRSKSRSPRPETAQPCSDFIHKNDFTDFKGNNSCGDEDKENNNDDANNNDKNDSNDRKPPPPSDGGSPFSLKVNTEKNGNNIDKDVDKPTTNDFSWESWPMIPRVSSCGVENNKSTVHNNNEEVNLSATKNPNKIFQQDRVEEMKDSNGISYNLPSANSSSEQTFETNDKCEVFFNSTIKVTNHDDLSNYNRSEDVDKSNISTLWLWYPVSSGYKAILWVSSLFNSFQPGGEEPSQR